MTAALLARTGVPEVSTLSVMASGESFGHHDGHPRFVAPEGRPGRGARERAVASVAPAHRAGVSIAAGTDFGGGSTRANQWWEFERWWGGGLEPGWRRVRVQAWRRLLGRRMRA